MPLSNYFEQAIVNWAAEGTAFPAAPANVYIALSTANPGETGAGIVEPDTADGYARQAVTFAAGAQGANSFTASNDAEVEFGPATDAWGSITHAALFDASSGGNMLWYGALTTPRTVAATDTFRFAVGQFTIGAQ